jgi:hypothetical protein
MMSAIQSIGQTSYYDFTTHDPATGELTDADSPPTCKVFEDVTDTAILTPTVVARDGHTGCYRVPVAATAVNGFEVGKTYNVHVDAVVGGVLAEAVLDTFFLEGGDIDDVLAAEASMASVWTPTRAGYLDALHTFIAGITSLADWLRGLGWLGALGSKTPTIRGTSGDTPFWVRPFDWLKLPAVVAGDEKAVALHAVFDSDANFAALICEGAYTVDWGDGSAAEDVATGVQAEHLYDYADLDAATECSLGYRQAIVTITPQAGQHLTTINWSRKHSQAGLPNGYSAQWLDIKVAGASLTSVGCYTLNAAYCRMLEGFELIGPHAITNMSFIFYNCVSLQWAELHETGNVTTFEEGLKYCYALRYFRLHNADSLVSTRHMFYGDYSLQIAYIPNAPNSGYARQMFAGCYSLHSVWPFTWGNPTSIGYVFDGCVSLPSVTLNINWAIANDLYGLFQNNLSLQEVSIPGCCLTVSFLNCKLSRDAIVAIFNDLASVTGKTITITGNWGVPYLTVDDLKTATDKGWTVVT